MHVGLVVGIGPAATDYYYRTIINEMRSTGNDLELTMVHADTPTLLRNQESGDVESQVRIYDKLTRRLRSAGADAVAITSIAGHFCIEEFSAISTLPVIDMCTIMREEVNARGLARVGLLGTRRVMESQFYGALAGVEVVAPPADLIEEVHATYIAVAQSGRCSAQQRSFFYSTGARMVAESHLDAILLAGTDLTLAFDGAPTGFTVVDCARVHALAIAAAARR
jgi:aspartate racemase